MWRWIEKLCEKRGPVAPPVRAMLEDPRATPAVLSFLRDTRVGRMTSLGPLGEEGDEEEGEVESEGEEAGPGPP